MDEDVDRESMLLKDLFKPTDSWEGYEQQLRIFSGHLETAARHLMKLYRFFERTNALDRQVHHATTLALLRELASLIDGAAILVERGAVEHGWRIARSALEASFFVAFILKADTVRRALAYQVAHFYRRNDVSERLDPSTDKGKALREDLKGDILEDAFKFNATQLAQIQTYKKVMTDPVYVEVQAEWLRIIAARKKTKQRGLPNWYSLFGGPPSFRALAKSLRLVSLYLQYEHWSGLVHVGAAFDNVWKQSADSDEVVLKPIRHPENISELTSFLGSLHVLVIRSVLEFLLPDEQLHGTFFSQLNISDWAETQKCIREGKYEIKCPWK